MKIILSLLFLSLFSMDGVRAQHSSHSHEEHLGKLLGHYFDMKDALVNDDFETANQSLALFKDEVHNSPAMNHHPDQPRQHAKHHGMMMEAVSTASRAEDIAQLRESFDELSNELLTALKNQGYTDDTIYVQWCPMQNDGDGAQWLSREKNILNPYFGAQMLKCGSTIEQLE